MNNRLALVTGSTGFIGTHLVKTLRQRGWSVRATVRASSSTQTLDDLGCEKVVWDLGSAEHNPAAISSKIDLCERAFNGVSHVFHVAGQVAGTPKQLDRVNRAGTQLLLDSMLQYTQQFNLVPPVVMLVSSAAAGGPSPAGRMRKPSDPPSPVSNYGRSKLAGEVEAIRLSADFPLTIVRPGIVFGDGDREFIKLFKAMRNILINPMIGLGKQPLGMIEVSDLIDLIIKAAESGKRCDIDSHSSGNGIYAAADPNPLSLRQLGQIYRRTLHRPSLNLPLPPAAGWLVATVSELISMISGKPSTLNRDKIREARAAGWVQDCTSTLQQIGWKPAKSIEQRLADTLRNAFGNGRL